MAGRGRSRFSGSRTLTTGDLTLRQDDAWVSTAPATLTRSGLLTVEAAATQETQAWMFETNKSTTLISSGGFGVSILIDIDVGTGDLIFDAGTRSLYGTTSVLAEISAANITLKGKATATTFRTGSLTFEATGDITVAGGLELAGSSIGNLTIRAGVGGTGNIIFTGTPTLSAGVLTLRQDDAFPTSAASFSFSPSVGSALVLETESAQTTANWMFGFANNLSVSVISQQGITVHGNLSAGTGNLVLRAGQGGSGNITFGTNRTLTGSNYQASNRIGHLGRTAPATLTYTE